MKLRCYAAVLGVLCHLLFACAVGLMAYTLFFGLSHPLLPVGGKVGGIVNFLLLMQFPILHSLFLTKRGAELLARLHPKAIGADLATTSFAIVASLQLLATFLFWTPSGTVWLAPHGSALVCWGMLFALSWVFLHKAITDAGIEVQSGFLGWSSVVRGVRPAYRSFPVRGLFGQCRQPIYLGFLLILLTAPVWGPDHLIITLVWGGYCVIGPLLKERRFARRYGEAFREYQRRVPYFLPPMRIPHERVTRTTGN